MEDTKVALVSDTDPEFLKLRADIRQKIRELELLYRKDMAEAFEAIKINVPARFIRGLLPAFEMLNKQEDADARRSRAILN